MKKYIYEIRINFIDSVLGKLIGYLKFLKFYLIATFFGLITDLFTYSFARNYFDIVLSASISFLVSQIVLFSILNSLQTRKIKKASYAFPLQLFISVGTVIIHIIVLKFLDNNLIKIDNLMIQKIFHEKNLYNFISKFIAACIGFIWTSTMLRKFIFKPKN